MGGADLVVPLGAELLPRSGEVRLSFGELFGERR